MGPIFISLSHLRIRLQHLVLKLKCMDILTDDKSNIKLTNILFRHLDCTDTERIPNHLGTILPPPSVNSYDGGVFFRHSDEYIQSVHKISSSDLNIP